MHIEHSVAPIRQGLQEKIDGCVIVFSDVSERKQLEEQLRQVQKMDAIGKLAGGIAHDFNNAITAIIGYAEMILLQVERGESALSATPSRSSAPPSTPRGSRISCSPSAASKCSSRAASICRRNSPTWKAWCGG